MTKVRILHAGGIGEHKQGDVVEDAHDGLVEIATRGIRNVADGELVAELVDAVVADEELDALRQRASELGVKGNIGAMKKATLETKVAEAEEALKNAGNQ